MFDNARIQQDFSKAAAHYDEYALLQRRVLGELVNRAKPFLSPHANILDAGCGTGRLAILLPEYSVIQLDISYAMCQQALNNGNPAIVANAEILPFAPATFDVAFSSLLFQWLPEWKTTLAELKRVAKPEGVIAVSTLGRNSLRELRRSFAEVDRYPHISPFITSDETWKRETITEYFPDFRSILHNLKIIGAGNKLTVRRKGMMTKSQLQKAENFYRQHFGDNSGLPVTWEVLYCVKRVSEL